MGDQSRKRLLRGSMTRRLTPFATLTQSRLQMTSSVRMMAKEKNMLLSTIQQRDRYLVACVIPIDHYGVPLLLLPFLCVRFPRESLHLSYHKRKEKELIYQLGSGFTLTTWYGKRRQKLFYRNFTAGARKPQRVETKMKRKKKVKDAFTNLILCATS